VNDTQNINLSNVFAFTLLSLVFNMRNGRSTFKIGCVLTLLTISFVAAILFISTISPSVVEKPTFVSKSVSERKVRLIPLGDGDPGSGNCGLCYAMAWQHNASPATDYAKNLSNSSQYCYEYSDFENMEMTGETPFFTAFDELVKFQFNNTVGYNSTSGSWEMDWMWMNITCSELGISSALTMEEVEITNTTDHIWITFYVQDADGGAGSGFQISHNQKYNITYEAWGFW
jgi:hypothetical protein